MQITRIIAEWRQGGHGIPWRTWVRPPKTPKPSHDLGRLGVVLGWGACLGPSSPPGGGVNPPPITGLAARSQARPHDDEDAHL